MKIKRGICYATFFLTLSFQSLHAQILSDTAEINLIRRGVDYIYDLKFDKALEVYEKISRDYPDNPIPYLFKGLITYWEVYPLVPDSPQCSSFVDDMHTCIDISEKKNNYSENPEYVLANLCARGMLLMYYADNGLSMSVFSLVGGTYHNIRRSFNYTSEYSDFYFFTGLYNYYREEYPDAHPVYKSLAILFPKGNKMRGLKEIQVAGNNSIFLKADSYSYLAYIYISYENDFTRALIYNSRLYEMYPDNYLFQTEYIKTLLLLKRYSDAEKLLDKCGSKNMNSYFRALFSVFNGIIQEKLYKNTYKAKIFYYEAIDGLQTYGEFGNDYQAYAYFGLSRISAMNGNKSDKKKYRKKALSLANFRKLDFDN
jgi:tetratricopeptide (TPR) repeat protein